VVIAAGCCPGVRKRYKSCVQESIGRGVSNREKEKEVGDNAYVVARSQRPVFVQ
jgi:hypothetical protein